MKNLIETYVDKKKEAGINIDYGFAVNPNIEQGDYVAVVKAVYEDTETEETFEEYLKNGIARAEEMIAGNQKVEEEAKKYDEYFQVAYDENVFSLTARTEISKIYKNLKKENPDNTTCQNAIQKAYNKAKKHLKGEKKNIVEKTVTGPVYDDDNPTYF